MAYRTSSTRLCSWSLCKVFCTWFCTVRCETTSRRTSVSRSVNRGGSSAGAGAAASRRYSPSTRPARPGVNTASPSAVRRTASRNSVRTADLSRYPVAPAFTASSTSCCSPLADSTSTRTGRYRAVGDPQLHLGTLPGRRGDDDRAAQIAHPALDGLGNAEAPGGHRLVEPPGRYPRAPVAQTRRCGADEHAQRRLLLPGEPAQLGRLSAQLRATPLDQREHL